MEHISLTMLMKSIRLSHLEVSPGYFTRNNSGGEESPSLSPCLSKSLNGIKETVPVPPQLYVREDQTETSVHDLVNRYDETN